MDISRRAWGSLALVAVLSWVACSKSPQRPQQIGDCQGPANTCISSGTGSGSGSGGGGDAGQCGVISFGGTCQVCMARACCSIMIRCSESADCLSLVRCMELCKTQSCVDDCATKIPNGVADLDGVFECLDATCKAECGAASDAGVDSAGACSQIVSPSAACEKCLGDNCCSEAEACAADPSCINYRVCLMNCPPTDSACLSNCQTLNPQGFASHVALGNCAQNACSGQCS